MKFRVGKSTYGVKWHLLKDNGFPICGYTSFNWNNNEVEEKEVGEKELKKLDLCVNCRRKLEGG